MTFDFDLDYEINRKELKDKILEICKKYKSDAESKIITKLIIRGEDMQVSTHGLHYFVHSIYPHLSISSPKFTVSSKNSFVISDGNGGIGFKNLWDCLQIASKKSEKEGIALVLCKNPGKVGALRVFCRELIDKGKFILLLKNTASTQGIKGISRPLVGTNPICIGFPESEFVFDSSTSTIATNSIRLMSKRGKKFDFDVGWNSSGDSSRDPDEILREGAFLSTFTQGHFWYKSFFLGVAIELLASLAGGLTGFRVGKHKGRRLHSKEGLFALVIDKSSFPHYQNYISELTFLREEMESEGLRFPGKFCRKDKFKISKEDWDFIANL